MTLTLTLTVALTLTLTRIPNPNTNPNQVFEPIEIKDDRELVLDGLCEMSKIIHSTVIAKADEFFAALKRRFYVTPKSFLELLSLYSSMLDEKRELMDMQIERLSIGCAKLNATNSMVQGMKGG